MNAAIKCECGESREFRAVACSEQAVDMAFDFGWHYVKAVESLLSNRATIYHVDITGTCPKCFAGESGVRHH